VKSCLQINRFPQTPSTALGYPMEPIEEGHAQVPVTGDSLSGVTGNGTLHLVRELEDRWPRTRDHRIRRRDGARNLRSEPLATRLSLRLQNDLAHSSAPRHFIMGCAHFGKGIGLADVVPELPFLRQTGGLVEDVALSDLVLFKPE
jgi:hypothetical protein